MTIIQPYNQVLSRSRLSEDRVSAKVKQSSTHESLDEAVLGENQYYDSVEDLKAQKSYYGNLAPSDDRTKFTRQLCDLTRRSHEVEVNYNPKKYVYPIIDRHPDGELRSVYSRAILSHLPLAIESDADCSPEAIQRRLAVGVVANPLQASIGLACDLAKSYLNCEHVVPQSWYDKKEPMRGDLHHLFACESRCNSSRGNTPYFDFDDWRRRDGGKRRNVQPSVSDCGKSVRNVGFEPAGGKGAVARATFYFLVRYPKMISAYSDDRLATLLKWSQEYPVTEYERHRNAEIQKVQGNRNPFIDNPEWALEVDWQSVLKSSKS